MHRLYCHTSLQIMAMGYKVPTPVQRKSLPATLAGADVVVMARTGSGKTAAFLVPVLEKLGEHSHKIGVRSIILSPTRELAVQVTQGYESSTRWTVQRRPTFCSHKNNREGRLRERQPRRQRAEAPARSWQRTNIVDFRSRNVAWCK